MLPPMSSAVASSNPPAAKVKFAGPDQFHEDIKRRVERYFSMTGKKQRGPISMYIKAAVLLTWFIGSYIALVWLAATWWQGLLLAVNLGLAMAAIGFCVQHDGGHKAFSRHRIVNRLAAMSLDMLGGSSYTW